jgi:hypothetical protein
MRVFATRIAGGECILIEVSRRDEGCGFVLRVRGDGTVVCKPDFPAAVRDAFNSAGAQASEDGVLVATVQQLEAI